MKIIRWLLSHSLFILLIVAVIYAYMFWGNLLGEDTPAGKAVAYLSEEFVEVNEFVNAVKEKQAQLSEENSSTQKAATEKVADEPVDAGGSDSAGAQIDTAAQTETAAVEPAIGNKTAVNNEVEEAAKAEASPAETQADQIAASTTVDTDAPKQDKDVSAEVEQQMNRAESSAVDATQAETQVTEMTASTTVDADVAKQDKYVPAEVEQQLNEADSSATTIDSNQLDTNVKDKWIAARKAFYQRNYALSEESYQHVIDSTKDNFDAYGELGNVYFNQGKHKEAATAYFEAATILVDKGQVYRAKSLLGLLRHLDPPRAEELQKLIDSAES